MCRFLKQGHGIDIDTEKVENGKAANERQLNLGIQTKIVVSAGKTICVAQRSPSAPTVLKVKEAWEEFLYPYPKTERMVFYNSLVQPLYCKSSKCHLNVNLVFGCLLYLFDVNI